MQTCDVAVITPAYRAESTIERAIRSVMAQTCPPAEMVVVVDGTFDRTAEIAESLIEDALPTRLIVLTQDNQGAGAARNRAIREASSRWVSFLDADDEWMPGKLARSLEVAEEGGYCLVGHDGVIRDGDGVEHPNEPSQRFRAAADVYAGLYRKGFLSTSSVMVERDRVLGLGGFDVGLPTAQDFDLWLKVLGQPEASFKVFDEVLTRYHVTPGSITSFTRRRLHCTERVALRHLASLKAKGCPVRANLAFRLAAIHREAFQAFWRSGARAAALGVLLRLVWSLRHFLKPIVP
ncbi:MAG: glycosyltransferase family 2 protein [Magnetovibrionaceae bacterium]